MKTMNKILSGFVLATVLLTGCTNQSIEFDDFTTQTAYFPLQYPIRTIVLGEDRLDNSIDLEKAFNIGVNVAGMYENKADRTIEFEVVPSLFPDVTLGGDTIFGKFNSVDYKLMPLPTQYYNLATQNSVTVPSGSKKGLIRVNLTDDFFNDPAAIKLSYVVPMKIKSVSHNFSILTGKAAEGITAPRWYVSSEWATGLQPKDYTLFAVKFINVWHGTYFQRGVQKKNNLVDKVFHKQDISADQTAKFTTVGLKKATYNRMGEFSSVNATTKLENYLSLLTFDDAVDGVGNVTVSAPAGSAFAIAGTGKYYKSSTALGKENGWIVDPVSGKTFGALTITLDYAVTGIAPATTYQFTDTLVFRSNDVKYEEFTVSPHIKK